MIPAACEVGACNMKLATLSSQCGAARCRCLAKNEVQRLLAGDAGYGLMAA